MDFAPAQTTATSVRASSSRSAETSQLRSADAPRRKYFNAGHRRDYHRCGHRRRPVAARGYDAVQVAEAHLRYERSGAAECLYLLADEARL